jgi:PEGA domain
MIGPSLIIEQIKFMVRHCRPIGILRAALLAVLATYVPFAQAQQPADPAPPPVVDAAPTPEQVAAELKERARARFDRGRELYDKQAWAAALAEFLEARKLYPTWSATAWSAQCLQKLERFDEAFDMYAVLVNEYGDKLPADAKRRALIEVENMRRLVGSIEIEGAEPGAAVSVDRQSRGDYPLLAPLRVAAGNHWVRVFAEGYEPFETRVDVAGATAVKVVARLRKLDTTGTLRVVEQQDRALDVVVDGIVVGKTPLTLRIAPGDHVVFLRGDDNLGTLPARIAVQGDKDAPLRLLAEPLESELYVKLTPFDALVAVDSITLGKGAWNGRVKPGEHTIEVAAEGFLPEKRIVELPRDSKLTVAISLKRDPSSPFWRKPEPPPHWFMELGLGVPLVTTIGGDVAGSCSESCSELPGFGLNPMVRAGYELPWGLSFGGSIGYLGFNQYLDERTAVARVVGRTPNTGTADDQFSFRGGSVHGFVGYGFGEKIRGILRLSVGLSFGSFADVRTGSLESNDGTPYAVGPLEQYQWLQLFEVIPEFRVGYRISPRIELSAGIKIPLLTPISTPIWNPAQAFTAGTDGYGYYDSATLVGSPFVAIVPTISALYEFR